MTPRHINGIIVGRFFGGYMLEYKEIFNTVVSSRRNKDIAEHYFGTDRVVEIAVHKAVGNHISINGIVDGSRGERYSCGINVNEDQRSVKYNCPCDFCTDETACAHVGAVLLELAVNTIRFYPFYYKREANNYHESVNEDGSDAYGGYSYLSERSRYEEEYQKQMRISRAELLLDKLQKNRFAHLDKNRFETDVEIVPSVSRNGTYGHGLFLEYRIGSDKSYILKNIHDLVDAVQYEKTIKYGKFLEFKHTLNSFTDFSQEQIAFFRELSYYMELKRDIPIIEDTIDAIADLYLKRNTIENVKYLHHDERKVTVDVEKVNDSYIFSIDFDLDVMVTKQGIYSVDVDRFITIEHTSFDANEATYELISRLTQGAIEIEASRISMFKQIVMEPVDADVTFVGVDIEETDLFNLTEYHVSTYIDLNTSDQISAHAIAKTDTGTEVISYIGKDRPYVLQEVEYVLGQYTEMLDETGSAIFDDGDDLTFDFLSEGIQRLSDISEVFVSDAIKALNIKKKYAITAGVRLNADLLHVDFDSTDIPKDELKDVLRAFKLKKRFHRLKDGEVINLDSKELETVVEVFDQYHVSLNDLDNGSIQVPTYRALDLDSFAITHDDITFDFDAQSHHIINTIKTINDSPIQIETELNTFLRSYQRNGVTWLMTLSQMQFGGILADDMGLGKTLQFLTYLDASKPTTPSLVVSPASVALNWIDEAHKFAPHLKTVAIVGSKEEREALIEDIGSYDLVITSYDYLRRDIDLYDTHEFFAVALDEAQYIKNHNTKNARSTKRLKAKHRFALTGTPIENSLAELWSIFDFIMPGYLFNYHYFSKHFERPIVLEKSVEVGARLRELVSPFILRRLKQDVLTELPDKSESTLLLEFSEDEKQLYFANLAQVSETLNATSEEGMDKIQVLAMLTRLRQLCCDPRVVYDNVNSVSTKIKACVELVETCKAEGKKVLVFSSFTTMLENIQREFDKHGIRSKIFEGKTQKTKRREMVHDFDTDDTDVLLISLKAGGTGINLVAAEVVIHFDPWWNISAQNQATDRAHRFGQTKHVSVYQLIMKDSVEERIQKLQMQKKEMSDAMIEGAEGSISSMSFDEIKDLFSV